MKDDMSEHTHAAGGVASAQLTVTKARMREMVKSLPNIVLGLAVLFTAAVQEASLFLIRPPQEDLYVRISYNHGEKIRQHKGYTDSVIINRI